MNRQEKQPDISARPMTEDQFLRTWRRAVAVLAELEVVLAPAKQAVCEFHKLREDIVIWDAPELSSGVGVMRVIIGGKFVPAGKEPKEIHWSLPVDNVLLGKDAVIAWLQEQKAQQEARAKQLGQERELREKEDRRQLFLKLKLEFEPPEGAIVKHEN